MAQDAAWGASGAAFGAPLGLILALRWAKLGPRWRYVGQLGAKMCALLGASCCLVLYLGRGLAKMGENQKNDDSASLLKVFLDLGALSEAMLAHLGAMLGDLGAILEQLGDKMWTESAKIAAKSAKMRQDGENGRPEREIGSLRKGAIHSGARE